MLGPERAQRPRLVRVSRRLFRRRPRPRIRGEGGASTLALEGCMAAEFRTSKERRRGAGVCVFVRTSAECITAAESPRWRTRVPTAACRSPLSRFGAALAGGLTNSAATSARSLSSPWRARCALSIHTSASSIRGEPSPSSTHFVAMRMRSSISRLARSALSAVRSLRSAISSVRLIARRCSMSVLCALSCASRWRLRSACRSCSAFWSFSRSSSSATRFLCASLRALSFAVSSRDGHTLDQAAAALGISVAALCHWRQKHGFPLDGRRITLPTASKAFGSACAFGWPCGGNGAGKAHDGRSGRGGDPDVRRGMVHTRLRRVGSHPSAVPIHLRDQRAIGNARGWARTSSSVSRLEEEVPLLPTRPRQPFPLLACQRVGTRLRDRPSRRFVSESVYRHDRGRNVEPFRIHKISPNPRCQEH